MFVKVAIGFYLAVKKTCYTNWLLFYHFCHWCILRPFLEVSCLLGIGGS